MMLLRATIALSLAILFNHVTAQLSILKTIQLSPGVSPEGIALAADKSPTMYAGRLTDGGVDVINMVTGEINALVPPKPNFASTGLWTRQNRLFVAGGGTPAIPSLRVYNANSGKELAVCPIDNPASFINDVVTFKRSSFWTDSSQNVIHILDHTNIAACRISNLTLPEAFEAEPGVFKANGVIRYRGGLLIAHLADGAVYYVENPRRGSGIFSQVIENGDAERVDGLALQNSDKLYTIQNALDQVGVFKLLKVGGVVTSKKIGILSSQRFSFPTTGFVFRGRLYVVNSRFDEVTPGSANATEPFSVVSVNNFRR